VIHIGLHNGEAVLGNQLLNQINTFLIRCDLDFKEGENIYEDLHHVMVLFYLGFQIRYVVTQIASASARDLMGTSLKLARCLQQLQRGECF